MRLKTLSQQAAAEIGREAAKFPDRRSALLSALYVAQREVGYVSEDAMEDVALLLGLTPVQVYDVATFYTLFHLKPVGKFVIQLCRTLSCALVGYESIFPHLKERLGIGIGETTSDGLFTLKTVECLAACGTAPAMQINDDYYENLTVKKIDRILADLKAKGRSALVSGRLRVPAEGSCPASGNGAQPLSPRGFPQQTTPGGVQFEKILLANMETPGYDGSLEAYRRRGGYESLKKAFAMTPEAVTEEIKKSGLRGRGGAGFPTGLKWSFIPKNHPGPKYLCCNADESEPGTFKDRQLLENDPHQMVEGMIIASYAIGAPLSYIYLRGEFAMGARIIQKAIEEAYAAGYLGKNILGSGFDHEILLYRGAGAYICGEETALLESIEGKRGKPRTKPPFPATHGLYGKPTVVNNVETLANVPYIVKHGGEWYASYGSGKSRGTRVVCVSGHVKRPGNYEIPMGITFRELIYGYAGGMIREDRALKAFIPGGASAAFFIPEQLDIQMDFEQVAAAGSILGSGGVTIMDDRTCMVWAAANLLQFFEHESCGKCTPCREGSGWLLNILRRIDAGEAGPEEIDLLVSLSRRIEGKTVCAFGDAEVAPVLSTIKHFRGEYERHIAEGRCPFRPNVLVSIGEAAPAGVQVAR